MELEERLKIVKNVAGKILKSNGVPASEYSSDDAVQDIWMTGKITDCEPRHIAYQTELRMIEIIRSKYGRNFKGKEKKHLRVGDSVQPDVTADTDTFYDKNGARDESLLTMEREEMSEIIKKCLKSTKDKGVFCRYYSGESLSEIAEELDISYDLAYYHWKKSAEVLKADPRIREMFPDQFK